MEETLRALSDLVSQGKILYYGVSRPEQLKNNIAASGFAIPKDALEEIEKILGFERFERHVG